MDVIRGYKSQGPGFIYCAMPCLDRLLRGRPNRFRTFEDSELGSKLSINRSVGLKTSGPDVRSLFVWNPQYDDLPKPS